jgi:hypothetical protein
MPVGDQFLFTTEQLAALVAMVAPETAALIALHDRAEAAGKKVVLRL